MLPNTSRRQILPVDKMVACQLPIFFFKRIVRLGQLMPLWSSIASLHQRTAELAEGMLFHPVPIDSCCRLILGDFGDMYTREACGGGGGEGVRGGHQTAQHSYSFFI